MDNNTLISIIFVSGTLSIFALRFIINKSMFNFHGQENKSAETFNSNEALTYNSILTFLMFIAILVYDGCTKDLELQYKEKYENVDKYLKERDQEAYDKAKSEIMNAIHSAITPNTAPR